MRLLRVHHTTNYNEAAITTKHIQCITFEILIVVVDVGPPVVPVHSPPPPLPTVPSLIDVDNDEGAPMAAAEATG